jgi:hypothetical protein
MTLWDYDSNTTHNLRSKLSVISVISVRQKKLSLTLSLTLKKVIVDVIVDVEKGYRKVKPETKNC